MKLRTSPVLFALASATLAVSTPSEALAAPAPACTPATMTPRVSSVPANLPGFGYTALKATTNDVHLTSVSGTRTELPITLGPVAEGYIAVKPVSPLVPGTSYELSFSPFCSYGPYPAQGPINFTATAEAPFPAKAGDLQTGPAVVLKDYGTTQFTITSTYAIAAEMKPWRAAYQLFLVLDGKVVPTVDLPSSNDLTQVIGTGWCDAANAATKKHTISLRAVLPFAPTVDSTPTTVEFDCPSPNIGTPPSTTLTPPTPGSSSSSSSSGSSGSPATGSSGGCAVASGSAGTSSLSLLGVALGLAALVRRRLSGASAATRRT